MTPSSSPCPLCANETGPVLWQDDFCRVILVDEARYPGFCRVILQRHAKEMSDLSPEARQRLMSVVFAVERAVRETVQPDKINLASLGNVVPHVHWHIIPRWGDDACFPDAIWAPPQREGRPRAVRPESLRADLGASLQAALSSRE